MRASFLKEGWGGEASVSGSTTSGNTSTTDTDVSIGVKKTDTITRAALVYTLN